MSDDDLIRRGDVKRVIAEEGLHILDKPIAALPAADIADALAAALRDLLTAVCGETGFAQSVRDHSGTAYPWPALDAAEEAATTALAAWEARK